ncbi:MAG TPA: AAA family ATPase [Anaerolineales bacterium]
MNSAKSSVYLYLLGRFEILREGRNLRADEWPRRKAAALIKYLAIQKRLVKDQAIDLFWPESDFDSGANNLYRTLHDLRQTLNKSLGEDTSDLLFKFEDGVLSLNESVWVDALEFEHLCSTLTKNQDVRIASLEEALALYKGDLLPDDLYAEWTLTQRESLRRQHRDASLVLSTLYRDARQYDRIFPLLSPLLVYDKADEPVHRELMRAYALAGRRHDALRQYQTCVEALASELDLAPEPETSALYTQILNGELTSSPSRSTKVEKGTWSVADRLQPSRFLVGRNVEFEALSTSLLSVQQSKGRTILIAGDQGVGKTLLAGEVLCAAAGAGMMTLSGTVHEQEGQLPYQPFIEAFDHYLVQHGQPPGENPITHFRGSGDPQQNQLGLFNAAAAFLIELASQAPVVLFIDDLHAADETSLHLFHYLARQTHTAQVVLLAACRADWTGSATTPLSSLLNALYRERLSETVNLSPLEEDAAAQIVNQTLEGEAVPQLLEAIQDIAEGNPFFIEEITRALLKSDQLEEYEGKWSPKPGAELHAPNDLEGLLRERAARLGPQVETVLTSAAVVGREFDFEILRRMTTLPEGELLDALDAALASNLLEETEMGYRFRHALTRHALYNSLSRARRARLHGRAGEAIEAIYAIRSQALAPYVEDLAYHFNLSERRDRALGYLIQAGQKAANLYAFEVAVRHFEQALALMDALALKDPAQRWMILESMGSWYAILADTPRAVECFERALALQSTESWTPAHHDHIRLHCSAANALITAGDMMAAETHLQLALSIANEQADAPEIADLFYNIALLHWHKGEYQEALDAAQKSLDIAEHIQRTEAIARAFEMLALACHSLGEWQRGLHFEEQRALLAGAGLDVTDAFDVHL